MPHIFATCTVKHFFKKKNQLPKKCLLIQSHLSFSNDPLLSVLVIVVRRMLFIYHKVLNSFILFLYSHPISTVCVGNAIKWYIMISSHLPRVMKFKKKKRRNKGFDCKLGQDYIEYILKMHYALKISLTVWFLADKIRTRL